MPVENSAGLVHKALIAALVGSVAGGTAGVWSLRSPAASGHAAAPALAASPMATRAASASTTDARPGAASSTSRVAATPLATRANMNAPPPSADDVRMLEWARTLARRPDVTALLALRDDVARRATQRGIAGAPSVKGELDELDLRLNEARALQLKLDAEEFRKAASKPAR